MGLVQDPGNYQAKISTEGVDGQGAPAVTYLVGTEKHRTGREGVGFVSTGRAGLDMRSPNL